MRVLHLKDIETNLGKTESKADRTTDRRELFSQNDGKGNYTLKIGTQRCYKEWQNETHLC